MAGAAVTAPEWLTTEYLEKILKDYLTFPAKSIEVTAGSKLGENFTSQVLRIRIKNEEKCLSVIAKVNLDTPFMQNLGDKGDFFQTEIQFFSELLPALQSPAKFDAVPKLYGIDLERNVIFLEDLTVDGFKTEPRCKYLGLKYCELTIDALAALHGASYHAMVKNPSLKKNYKNLYWTREKDAASYAFFTNAYKTVQANIDKYGLSESQQKKLASIKEKVDAEWFQDMELKEGQLNFLIHGDCWANNLLFHYQDGNLDSVKLIDFQLVSYSSFANDFTCFLFVSADVNVLLYQLDYLVERYFNKLRSIAPDVPGLTLERLKKELSERYFSGFIVSLMYRPLFLFEVAPDLEEVYEDGDATSCFTDPRFISEFKQLFEFFEKEGVF